MTDPAPAATPPADWYTAGCARDCSTQHTYTLGRCALSTEDPPEPMVTIGRVETMDDGAPGIVLRAVPVSAWEALIKAAIRASGGRGAVFAPGPGAQGSPDASARRALGALHDAGLLPEPEAATCTWPGCLTDSQHHDLTEEVRLAELGEATTPMPDQRQTCGCTDTGGDGQGEAAEIRTLPREVRRLVHAVDRADGEWVKSSMSRWLELWREVRDACAAVWDWQGAQGVSVFTGSRENPGGPPGTPRPIPWADSVGMDYDPGPIGKRPEGWAPTARLATEGKRTRPAPACGEEYTEGHADAGRCTARVAFSDAVETATEEEMSGPDPEEHDHAYRDMVNAPLSPAGGLPARIVAAVETALGDELLPAARSDAIRRVEELLTPAGADGLREQITAALIEVRRDGMGGCTEAEACQCYAAAVLDVIRPRLAQIAVEQERYEEQVVGTFNEQATALARRAGRAEAEAQRLRVVHDAVRPRVAPDVEADNWQLRARLGRIITHRNRLEADLAAETALRKERTDLYDTWRAKANELGAALARVRALHQPVEGLGFGCDEDETPGSYGDIAQVCTSCGTADEYGVRWPCPTIHALDCPADTTPPAGQSAADACNPDTQEPR